MNRNILILVCIIVLLIILLSSIIYSEGLKNDLKIEYLFKSNVFNNKTIFLIANNTNLSEASKLFLNKFDYTNSVIVRFNGFKNIIKDYCLGKTDIMVYRKCEGGFHGFNKYNSDFINVFTEDGNDMKDNYISIDNLPSQFNKYSNDIFNNKTFFMATGSFFDNNKKYYYTSGFQFLLNLVKIIDKIPKIYLVGYTFHNKDVSFWHNSLYEYNYFNENIKHLSEIECLL